MAKRSAVPRPIKSTEFSILFATRNAQRGWSDLLATRRNAVVEAWDFLTKNPHLVTPSNYPLKGALSTVTRGGMLHDRWQHKLSVREGSRIWFYVEERCVYLERVHTAHPNATK